MKKRYCIIFCILFFPVFFACKTDIKQEPVKKDGMVYGITKGAFRHNWWNYYERGVSFADGRLWPQAEADFREAVSLWDTDERRARTYGMHFIDYFPHRELGTALFYQDRFEEAAKELEKSLSFVKTAKAELYLDRARKAYIEQKRLDKTPPGITIEYPGKNAVLNDFKIIVKGRASDDTFVKEVLVNNKAFQIDLSGQVIDFKQEISLSPGKNDIMLEARDLTGKITKTTHTIMCDRAGPILNIDDILHSSGSEYILKGYAYDDSQIRNITVNKKIISENPGSEVLIDYSFQLASNEKIEITALDAAGNQTRAVLSPPKNQPEISAYKNKESYYASLVSDALYYAGMDKNQAEQRGRAIAAPPPVKSRYCESLGEYYALITGINEYEQWPVLKTAVNDAMGMKDVLVRRYGFKEENVVLRINEQADWNTMLNDLRQMAGRLTECDNLLIYFAGHGKVDPLTNGGSWIPVNGSLNNATTWVSNSAITEIFSSEGVIGKNIVIIADSCYSGTLLREGSTTVSDTEEDYQTRLLELGSKKSRQIITSGGNEPVADSGMDNHSIFAYYLLRSLEENQRPIIDIENLMLSYVWKYVTEKGGQRPNIGRLKTPMDDYGQFVLALGGILPEGLEIPSFSRMRRTHETPVSSNYSDYIDKNPPKIEVKKWIPKKTVFQDKAYLEGKAEDETGIQILLLTGIIS
ncbi:Caspase domain-containing protein [Desulfonema limicola]|uniref:Caspase domain-containing protein n=1 Tax=Desulfonema limicola TaxID=45656 RepID=A0A975GIA5_9BACT|nr:caspase family protein [Desulfonema limicola]QTA81718.1 Caspase domain-containing protein [Desulfonema limicola]